MASATILDRGQRVGLIVLDDEQLRQFRDREDFVNLRANIRQDQLGAVLLHALVEADQLAERGAGQELDVGEIEHDLFLVLPVRPGRTAPARIPESPPRR